MKEIEITREDGDFNKMKNFFRSWIHEYANPRIGMVYPMGFGSSLSYFGLVHQRSAAETHTNVPMMVSKAIAANLPEQGQSWYRKELYEREKR